MRKGRDLELLVEDIKKLQLPEAVIKSPEYVADRDTGTRREVDIGIRQMHGNDEIFIAVECRDKKATQDIQWIEQLITKKESVGAHALFAVTTSNFSESAIIKAEKRGVFLRRVISKLPGEIDNISNSFFITYEFFQPQNIRISIPNYFGYRGSFQECKYILRSKNVTLTFDELVQLLCQRNMYDMAAKRAYELKNEVGGMRGIIGFEANAFSTRY